LLAYAVLGGVSSLPRWKLGEERIEHRRRTPVIRPTGRILPCLRAGEWHLTKKSRVPVGEIWV
jgi:hypothetical protein